MSKMDELTAWGFGKDETMDRFLDDEELYFDCLGSFITDENFALLDTSLQNQDWDSAFMAAHTLKGVSANLGLDPLTKPISDITEELRYKSNKNLDELSQKIHEKLEEVKKIMQ